MEGINTPFVIDEHTAIVMTDPQNDFLSENGLGWGAFGENIQKNGTVENLRRIFEVAAAKGMLVFISPHFTTLPYDMRIPSFPAFPSPASGN